MVNHYLIRCKDDETLFEIHTNATEPEKREKLQNDYRQKHSYEGDVELVKISYKSPITYESYSNRGPLINQKKQFKLDKKQFTSERVDELRQGKEIGDPEGLLKLEELDRLKEILPKCVTNKVFEEMYGLTDSDSYCQLSAEFHSNKKNKSIGDKVVTETVGEETVEEESIEDEQEIKDDNQVYEFKGDILNEDCILGMKKMPNDSIDIIICDPPYNIGKDFGNNSDKQEMNTYLEWCDEWIDECIRILKPDGTLFIYGFSEILAFIRVRISINVRWIIWHYTNKVTPSLNFWQRTHESILCCYKDKPHFNRDEVREPYTEGYLKNAAGKVRKGTKGRFGSKETVYTAHKNGALPRDVIKISALAGGAGKKERVDHPTQKPLELCEKLIKSSMKKPEETFVVVPFAGSGSECVAAKNLGVNFVGFEINPEYVELCKSRLN